MRSDIYVIIKKNLVYISQIFILSIFMLIQSLNNCVAGEAIDITTADKDSSLSICVVNKDIHLVISDARDLPYTVFQSADISVNNKNESKPYVVYLECDSLINMDTGQPMPDAVCYVKVTGGSTGGKIFYENILFSEAKKIPVFKSNDNGDSDAINVAFYIDVRDILLAAGQYRAVVRYSLEES